VQRLVEEGRQQLEEALELTQAKVHHLLEEAQGSLDRMKQELREQEEVSAQTRRSAKAMRMLEEE
jgi:hypothetical protein